MGVNQPSNPGSNSGSQRGVCRMFQFRRLVGGSLLSLALCAGFATALAGDEAGEARWHASALKGVHHVAILVDDGSCDGAGENSANVRYEMGDVL